MNEHEPHNLVVQENRVSSGSAFNMNGYSSMYDGLDAAKSDPSPKPKPLTPAPLVRSILKKANAAPPPSR